jgi:hypothetical protein
MLVFKQLFTFLKVRCSISLVVTGVPEETPLQEKPRAEFSLSLFLYQGILSEEEGSAQLTSLSK